MKAVATNRRISWWPLIIVVAGLLAYTGSFGAPFVFDDNVILPRTATPGRWWPSMPAPRYLVDLSFRLNGLMPSRLPADYRMVNVVLHLVAALLLFGVVRRVFERLNTASRFSLSPSMGAGLVALLWSLHPVQTESVTYVAQRYECLMGLFGFLSLYGLMRSAEGPHGRLWGNISLAACAGAMASKENAVVLPIFLFMADAVLLSDGYLQALRRRWKLHLAYTLTWGILAVLMMSLWRVSLQAPTLVVGSDTMTAAQYWLTQPEIFVHYFRLCLLPWPLCFDYAWSPVEHWSRAIVPGIVVGAVGAGCAWGLVRRSPWALLGAWFFGILAPTALIVMPDLMFEHRLYLPLAAVAVAAVVVFHGGLCRGQCQGWWSERFVAVAVLGGGVAAALLLFSMTVARNQDYGSEERLWKSVLRCRPENLRARLGLGVSHLRNGQREEAARLFAGIIEATEAKDGGLGADDRTQRCQALNNMGVVLEQEGRYAEAATYFRRAVETAPRFVDAKSNLAVALAAIGQNEEAHRLWREVIAASPGHGPTHYRLGHWLGQRRDYRGAIRHLTIAISVAGDLVPAKLELAWWLSVTPDSSLRDGARALELAQDVIRVTGGESVRAQEVLAAAYAEVGEFRYAAAHAAHALELARGAGFGGVEVIDERIKRYTDRKPWREP